MPKKKVVTREEFDRLFKMDSAIVSSLQSRLDIIETAVDEYILPPIIDILTGLRRLEARLSTEIGRNEANEQICEDRSDALSDEREAIVKRLDKIEERLAESDEDQHEVFLYNKAKDEADETAFGLADDRLTALESQVSKIDSFCGALPKEIPVADILTRLDKLEQNDRFDALFMGRGLNDIVMGINDRIAKLESIIEAARLPLTVQPRSAAPPSCTCVPYNGFHTDLGNCKQSPAPQPVSSNSWSALAGVLCGCGAPTQSPRRIMPEPEPDYKALYLKLWNKVLHEDYIVVEGHQCRVDKTSRRITSKQLQELHSAEMRPASTPYWDRLADSLNAFIFGEEKK